MAINPAHDFEPTEFAPKPTPGPRFRVLRVLLILGIGALVVALFLPASRSTRPIRRRLQCASNLRQIALAIQGYEQAYHALPPAYTVDAAGRPLHSWRTLILPYLDNQELYDAIDLTKPWDDPVNAVALQTRVSLYHCHESVEPKHTTTYLAVVAPGGCFLPTRGRRLAEITDAPSSTLMLIEGGEANAVPWMAPMDAGEAVVLGLGSANDLHHAGGMNVGFVDGSIKFLSAAIPAPIRRALVSIAGRDAIDPSAIGD